MPSSTDPWLTGDMRHEQLLNEVEHDMLSALGAAQRAFLNECRRSVLHTNTTAAARPKGLSIENWPSRERWAELLQQHVLPALRRWYRRLFKRTYDAAPRAMSEWERDYLAQFAADPWPDRLYEQVAEELDDSITAGDPFELQRDRLDLVLRMKAPVRRIRDQITNYRRQGKKVPDGVWELAADEETHRNEARQRARFYTVGTYNRATLDAGEQMSRDTGEQLFKTWYSVHDERVRPTHWAAHKQSVALSDRFRVGRGDLRYPGDPLGPIEEIANCRCTTLINDSEESAQMNMEREQELPFRTDADGNPLVAADKPKPKKKAPESERDGEPTEPGRPEDAPPQDPAQPPERPAPGEQPDTGNRPQPEDPGVQPPARNTPQVPQNAPQQPGEPGPQETAPGEAGPPGGTRAIAEEEAQEVQPTADGRWRGLLAPLDTRGDFRVIGTPPDGVVRTRDRMWLAWQKSAEDEHKGKVVVGRIDRAWIENGNLMGEGVLDMGDEDAIELHRKLSEGFAGTVSVDLDDAEAEERFYDAEGFEVDDSGAPKFATRSIVAAPPGPPSRKKPRVPTRPESDSDSGGGEKKPSSEQKPAGEKPAGDSDSDEPEERATPGELPDGGEGIGEKDTAEPGQEGDQPRRLLYVYNWRLGGATVVADPAFHTANIQLVSPGTTPAQEQAAQAQQAMMPGEQPAPGQQPVPGQEPAAPGQAPAPGQQPAPADGGAGQQPEGSGEETGEARKKKSESSNVTINVGASANEFVARTPSGGVKESARDKAAESGNALPDGSFPINNVADLKNAIQAIGRAKDPAKAKAHIRKRARALGRTDLIPTTWGSSKKSETASAQSWAEKVAANVPLEPPVEWFQNPQLDRPSKVRVDDSGRVFGHVAAWNTDHISYPGRGVRPPRSNTNYAQFHRHPVRCSGGERIRTGALVMGTGHADLAMSESSASAHYDHTGHNVADVVAGEDAHGIWVSGSLRPGVSALQVLVLDRYSLSGDWRNGELVAALSVNVPGFPIADGEDSIALAAAGAPLVEPRLRIKTDAHGDTYALVASGVITTTVPTTGTTTYSPEEERAWNELRARRRIERIDSRIHSMARRVHRPNVTAAAQRVFAFSNATAELPLELQLAEQHLTSYAASNGAGHGYNADEFDELDDQDHRLIKRITDTNWSLDDDTDTAGESESSSSATAGAFAKRKNWVDKQGGLPSYVKRIAKHLKAKGMNKSRSIATAINVAKKMCRGGDKLNFPGAQKNVNKGSVAQACAAVTQWDSMKAREAAD